MKALRTTCLALTILVSTKSFSKGGYLFIEPLFSGSYYRWTQSLDGATKGPIAGYAYSYTYGLNLLFNLSKKFYLGLGYKDSFVNWRYVEDEGYSGDNDWKEGSAARLSEKSVMLGFRHKSSRFFIGHSFSSTLSFDAYYISGMGKTIFNGTGNFIGLQRPLSKRTTWSIILKSNTFNNAEINSVSQNLPATINGIELSKIDLNSFEFVLSWPIEVL